MLSKSQRVSRVLGTLLKVNNKSSAAFATQVVTMPALSPTMTSGKIAKWSKKGECLGISFSWCSISSTNALT